MTPYLASLLLLQQAVICTSMVPRHRHDAGNSGLNTVDGKTKTKVFSESSLFKNIRKGQESSTIPSFTDKNFWRLILGLEKYSPTGSSSKSNPSGGLSKLQIVAKSSTFMPGVSFLQMGKKLDNNKTEEKQSKYVKSERKLSKQHSKRRKHHKSAQHGGKRKLEILENKHFRFDSKNIQQILHDLWNQAGATSTHSPLKTTTGLNSVMTDKGNTSEIDPYSINLIGKQAKEVKAESKYETTTHTNINKDPAVYPHLEQSEVTPMTNVKDQPVTTMPPSNSISNSKLTSKVKRHTNSGHPGERKSNSDYQTHRNIESSKDFGVYMEPARRLVQHHDIPMNHQDSPSSGKFTIKQRTVDFLDPYTIEQRMKEESSRKKSKTPLRPENGIEPDVKLDFLATNSLNKHTGSQISRSSYTPQNVNDKVFSTEGHQVQSHSWHGYDPYSHGGLHGNSESHFDNFQRNQHQIPIHPERQFIEQNNFNVKQVPQSPRKPVKHITNTPDYHVNQEGPFGNHGDHRHNYNQMNSGHEISPDNVQGQNQGISTHNTWTVDSTTTITPTVWEPTSKSTPSHHAWNHYNNGPLTQQQREDQQGGQQAEQILWNGPGNNQNTQHQEQNENYQNTGQEIDPYSPYDYTQDLSQYTSQRYPNEQYGQQEHEYPQQWNENQDTAAWPSDPARETGQYRSDNTFSNNNNNGYVESNSNYPSLQDQNTQQAYQGESQAQIYAQRSQTNFQMPPGWNVYSDQGVQDTTTSTVEQNPEIQDAYEFSNNDEDSDEK